jgi:transketolase
MHVPPSDIIPAAPVTEVKILLSLSRSIRLSVVEMAHAAHAGHVGPALSIVELLATLYGEFLRVDPHKPADPNRDRFILSKGHAAQALYATLAHRGFFPREELATYLKDGSRLAGHPSTKVPGVELSTGSLGHGLNVGLGLALAARLAHRTYRTVVLLSDGECDEGSTWEAAMAAGHWKTGKLIAIVDYNKIQSFGRIADVMDLEPFAAKWGAFRWHVHSCDGHDPSAILAALREADKEGGPSVLLAHTVKGKGIPSMEDTVESHYFPLTDEQYEQARRSLISVQDRAN